MNASSRQPASDSTSTVRFVLDASAAYLGRRGVEDARLDAEHLAARLLRCRRLDLSMRSEQTLSARQLEAMRRGVQRVGAGEPVQYVLGQWDFRGLTLKTDARALIPRPETEMLVQLLLDSPVLRGREPLRVLDFGTGSGCIALSLVAERPAARVVAVDVSGTALDLARENAAALGLADRVTFLNVADIDLADVLEPGSMDAIISNPPYIPSAACDKLPLKVRGFEPRGALDGGPDGMQVIRHLLEEATLLLATGGAIFLEISAEDNQARVLTRQMEAIGFDTIAVHRDAGGHARFLAATLADGV